MKAILFIGILLIVIGGVILDNNDEHLIFGIPALVVGMITFFYSIIWFYRSKKLKSRNNGTV
jgi:hypothetical protein